MKKHEIQVGAKYTAKISGKPAVVQVLTIRKTTKFGKNVTVYDVVSMTSKREMVFNSAQRFLRPAVNAPEPVTVKVEEKKPSLTAKIQDAGKKPWQDIVVRAYAGTGKTFTQIVGVAWAYAPEIWDKVVEGIWRMGHGAEKMPKTFEVKPSPEQQEVWNAMAETRGETKSVVYCAFNKSIVGEFSEKWGWLVELLQTQGIMLKFATINSLGNGSVFKAYGRCQPTEKHSENLLAKRMGYGDDCWKMRSEEPTVVNAVTKVVGLAKLNLLGWDGRVFDVERITDGDLDELVRHYDIDMNGSRDKIYRLVVEVLRDSMDVRGEIDFDDQNWLPVIKKLPVNQYDLALIDEAQDLNKCKQEFCLRLARRLMVVGDIYQAIYGFAGADVDSIPRIEKMLNAKVLRLSETRRCGKAIVQEARQYVKDFQAHDSNSEGRIGTTTEGKLVDLCCDGDMVLSRVNAPLISNALNLIKAGKKAIIRGRDFGDQLVKFVEKLGKEGVEELVMKVGDWASNETRKEEAKKNPSEAKLISIRDREACIYAFCEGATTVSEVLERIKLVFAGKQCPKCGRYYGENVDRCFNQKCQTEVDENGRSCGPRLVNPKGVLHSSIHRAKGLEAKRVFFLKTKNAPCPHPMAKTDWARGQEQNLCYVAVTRAIEELVYVTD